MQIPILMYHSISDTSISTRRLLTVSVSTFASHLEYLKSQAYFPLTVSTLVSFLSNKIDQLPNKPVVLTFDDGLADFFTGALPVLDKYGFPATLYIPTAYVGQTGRWSKSLGKGNYPLLSWSEIQEIVDHGIECGSHGHFHTQLDILPIKEMQQEVRISKDSLEQHLQKSVSSLSYPYGLNCTILRQIVQQAGYSSACAVRHSMTTLADDRYALPRIAITSDLSLAKYHDFLMGKGLRRSYQNERMRTKIYRFFRKLNSRLKKG